MEKNSTDTNKKGRKDQENLDNRGYEEDHPNNPVRTTGSPQKNQETLPTGEPDPDEAKKVDRNNQTGPGLG